MVLLLAILYQSTEEIQHYRKVGAKQLLFCHQYGTNSSSSLARRQLARALGGAHDGLDEGDAEAAFLEFEDAVDGAAGGVVTASLRRAGW